MENKIYLKQLESYQTASEKARKRMGKNPCFDLELLPTDIMREEIWAYIMKRSKELSAEKLYSEKRYYHHLCQLIRENRKKLKSFRDWNKKMDTTDERVAFAVGTSAVV